MSNVIDVVFAAPRTRARVFPYFAPVVETEPTPVIALPENTRGMSLFAMLHSLAPHSTAISDCGHEKSAPGEGRS